MLDAIELLKRYASTSGKSRYYEATDTVPLDGVVPKSWRPAVIDDRGHVERIPYELCVLVALRNAIRRRAVFIDDARRWRDPDHDLPADFCQRRRIPAVVWVCVGVIPQLGVGVIPQFCGEAGR